MFVDHLTDGIAQQHDKLVETFNGALQLDAVDQENGYRNAFTTKGIQKRVLQGLGLIHGKLRIIFGLFIVALVCGKRTHAPCSLAHLIRCLGQAIVKIPGL
jgi:hypothetical protein